MTTGQNVVKKSVIDTQSLVMMAMFAAIICISAYWSIPLPLPGSPHLTLQNFVILLVALLFPVWQSFLIVFVWMLLGAIGLPVFIAGGSGIGYLTCAWGGYTVSFILAAIVLPLIRGKKYGRMRYTAAAILGVLLIDFFGMVWLKMFGLEGYDSWKEVFLGGFVAFLPMDLVKAVVVAQVMPAFHRVLAAGKRI